MTSPAASGGPADVEVRRSSRRRRTVSAYREGERTIVLLPARMSAAEEQQWVATMLERLEAQERRSKPSDDELWVQSPGASRNAPARYVVFSRSGSRIALVSVPAGFRVTDIGRDYVLGVHRADDGVETVRVYALSR